MDDLPISMLFPVSFYRETYEKIDARREMVAKFVCSAVTNQIEQAKNNKENSVLIHVEYPSSWNISCVVRSEIISEMVHRFQPVEIPWGCDSWKSIVDEDLMEICTSHVSKFRFTINFQ